MSFAQECNKIAGPQSLSFRKDFSSKWLLENKEREKKNEQL